MLRCMGCERIGLRHQSWLEDDSEPSVHYFPPAIFRHKPGWLEGLWLFEQPIDDVVAGLLTEIYSALQNNAPRLAAMGVLSLIEHIMIAKVGDQRSFAKNLAKFEGEGYISRVQRERLETILEAGHATTHRNFKPSRNDVITLVDIAESIVETIYVHEEQVAALRKRVPTRDRNSTTSHPRKGSLNGYGCWYGSTAAIVSDHVYLTDNGHHRIRSHSLHSTSFLPG